MLHLPDFKLNTFAIIFLNLFGTENRIYGLSVVLQHPLHLLTLIVNWLKRVSLEFVLLSNDPVWHGWLFIYKHFVGLLELKDNDFQKLSTVQTLKDITDFLDKSRRYFILFIFFYILYFFH